MIRTILSKFVMVRTTRADDMVRISLVIAAIIGVTRTIAIGANFNKFQEGQKFLII